jgi:hypothetical protein
VPTSSAGKVSVPFSATNPVHGFFVFNWTGTSISGSYNGTFAEFEDASNNELCLAGIKISGANYVLNLWSGSWGSGGTTAITMDTTYCLWLDYTEGTGANAACTAYLAAATGTSSALVCTKPGSPEMSITTGTPTTEAAQLDYLTTNISGYSVTNIYDWIRVSPSTIGSSPQ